MSSRSAIHSDVYIYNRITLNNQSIECFNVLSRWQLFVTMVKKNKSNGIERFQHKYDTMNAQPITNFRNITWLLPFTAIDLASEPIVKTIWMELYFY